MVEVSRDGRRVYVTNSLYSSWDEQFYPEASTAGSRSSTRRPTAGMALDPDSSSPTSTAGDRTRCACRAATPPPTRTASRRAGGGGRTLLALAGLGALHGAEPRDGLAVRRGDRPAGALARGARRALVPIAIGHEASVALTVLATRRRLTPGSAWSGIAGGVVLSRSAAWKLWRPRATRAGSGARLSPRELALVVPDVDRPRRRADAVAVRGSRDRGTTRSARRRRRHVPRRLRAAAVHTPAMLVVTAAVALLVYQVVGVGLPPQGLGQRRSCVGGRARDRRHGDALHLTVPLGSLAWRNRTRNLAWKGRTRGSARR